MSAALIALGSNLGDRERILNDAVAQLEVEPGIHVLAKSQWRATRPVGGPGGQGDFLNGAAIVETSLSPHELFAALQQIETAAGRTRGERWAARTLDLDLLLYDEQVIDTPNLIVPHPRMSFRRFVLEPAAEVAPTMRHPTIGATVVELRDHVRVRSPYVAAITGLTAAERTTLATAVATAVAGRAVLDPAPSDISTSSFRSGKTDIQSITEILDHRAEPIRAAAWTSTDSMAISDYWFDDLFGQTLPRVPVDRLLEFIKYHHELAKSIAIPKLLVNLETSTAAAWWETAFASDFPNSARLSELLRGTRGKSLRTMIKRNWRGPLLRVGGSNLGETRDEVVAAIRAMQ